MIAAVIETAAADDEPNGRGSLTFANGDEYVGEFRNGKQNGQGAYTSAKGEKYVGEFKDGKRNGQGATYAADESILLSWRWADGKFVEAAANRAVQPR